MGSATSAGRYDRPLFLTRGDDEQFCYGPVVPSREGSPSPGALADGAQRWRRSVKLESWPKILVPMALGQCVGVAVTGRLSTPAAVLGALFAVAMTLYVVWLNDWADQDVDRIKRRMFPDGCSLKTIPDEILPAPLVLLAGVAAGLLAFGVAIAATVGLERGLASTAALVGLSIFAVYSLPPVRLNYRGGGELLEMLGLGVFLPWFGAYLQSGDVWARELWVLLGFLPLCLASSIASGLADEQSDRKGGKVTLTTVMGNEAARSYTENCVALGGVVWAISARLFPDLLPPLAWFAVVAVLYFHYGRMIKASPEAQTNAFEAQREYKKHLHRAIWHSALVLGGLFAWLG